MPHPVQPLSTLQTPRRRDARKTRSRPACSALNGPDFHWQAHSSFPLAPRIRLPPWVFDGKALTWPGVEDTRLREPIVCELPHALPLGVIPLAPPPQRASPEVNHMVAEGTQRPIIGRDCVIVEEAGHDLPQPVPLSRDRLMQPPSHFLLDVLELRSHAIPTGLAREQELSPTGFAADEGEAQEVEGLRFADPALDAIRRRMATERDQTGFLRMKRQREH